MSHSNPKMFTNTTSGQPRGTLAVMCCFLVSGLILVRGLSAEESVNQRTYPLRLVRIQNPKPLLADYPEFVEPIRETARCEAPILVDDVGGDLSVRAWRTQFNARCIIEMPNRLKAARTAIIVVHPWGINDGQGWRLPQPAGFAFASPPARRNIERHLQKVINPFLKSMRGKVAGGGVKGGLAYGATDDYGYEAVEGRVHIHDLHATLLHLLGLDHEQLTYRYAGRDFHLTDVHGRVVHEVIA